MYVDDVHICKITQSIQTLLRLLFFFVFDEIKKNLVCFSKTLSNSVSKYMTFTEVNAKILGK